MKIAFTKIKPSESVVIEVNGDPGVCAIEIKRFLKNLYGYTIDIHDGEKIE